MINWNEELLICKKDCHMNGWMEDDAGYWHSFETFRSFIFFKSWLTQTLKYFLSSFGIHKTFLSPPYTMTEGGGASLSVSIPAGAHAPSADANERAGRQFEEGKSFKPLLLVKAVFANDSATQTSPCFTLYLLQHQSFHLKKSLLKVQSS